MSPCTQEGEMLGSRTEFIHWSQDVHDQRAILDQYCRYTAEIRTARNIKQIINRALAFAKSDPRGPVYLCATREVTESEVDRCEINQAYWNPIELAPLIGEVIQEIVDALVHSQEPLIITGYTGRNHETIPELVKLADSIKGLRVLDTGGMEMCFPANHPASLGFAFSVHDAIKTSDLILVLDCDVPWIPTRCKPKDNAKIYHIDVDPLKDQMALFYIKALRRCRADSCLAIKQINAFLEDGKMKYDTVLNSNVYAERWIRMKDNYKRRQERLSCEAEASSDSRVTVAHLISELRGACPMDTKFVIEAVTNTTIVADQLRLSTPGSWLNCGGGGLGWSGGAALGIKLATERMGDPKFVCQIVGDGSYLFSFPSSVYWVSSRYKIPILTIVLNNKGWNAPRNSLLLVRPDGPASKVSNEELCISFAPTPDFAGLGKAAGAGQVGAFVVSKAAEVKDVLVEAISMVESGKSAVVEVQVN